jgi:hypothetical protein
MELIAVGLAADSINKGVAMYSLAALQLSKNTTSSGVDPNPRNLFREPKCDTLLAQVVRQRFDDLPIHEIQNNRPLVDQRNLGTEGSHKGCVLEAYDAGSHYDDFFRETTQIAKVIGVHNATVVKGNVRAVRGPGTAGNQDLTAFEPDSFAFAALNLECVRVQKRRTPRVDYNPVPFQLGTNYLGLSRDDGFDTEGDSFDGNVDTTSRPSAVQRPNSKSA